MRIASLVAVELLFGIFARGLLLHPIVISRRNNVCRLNAQQKENKAMEFLRKVGRVGNNQDFTHAIGVDEGPSGKAKGGKLEKAAAAIRPCAETGIIDDLQEQFPSTSCGTQWSGFTDQVMGGVSMARLTREMFDGRMANVLRGNVKMDNNGGFIQMAANLQRDGTSIDVSAFDGVELLVQSGSQQTESFNVHVKTTDCLRPFSSYRQTFDVRPSLWEQIRLPFADFRGRGPGAENTPFDSSALKRLGIVALGRPMTVELAIAGVRLYKQGETRSATTTTIRPE